MAIPEDVLWKGILPRLPIESAMRFNCVCRSWPALIDRIDFARSHFHKSNRNNDQFIITKQAPNSLQRFFSLKCDELCKFGKELTSCLPPLTIDVKLLNTCNGLLCLSDYKSFVSLWNPTTREFVKLPSGLPSSPLSNLYQSHMIMGLGCDVYMEEYKMLSIFFFYESKEKGNYTRCKVKVQTLGTNSWRNVRVSPLRPFYDQCSRLEDDRRLVNFNGALHWAVQHFTTNGGFIYVIVSFDLRDERFGEIPLPDCLQNYRLKCFRVEVLQGCLSVVCHQYPRLEVWTMNDYGVKNSWTLKSSFLYHTINFATPPLVFSSNNNERIKLQGMCLNKKLHLFNPVTKACQPLQIVSTVDNFFRSKIAYLKTYISIASLIGGQDHESPPQRRRLL